MIAMFGEGHKGNIDEVVADMNVHLQHLEYDAGKFRSGWQSVLRQILAPAAFAFCAMPLMTAPVSANEANRLGFVVESWYTAIHDTPYMEECPEGLALSNAHIWFDGLSPADKETLTNGGTDELMARTRNQFQMLRGPNGEDVCHYPESVVDPPMRIIHGKYAYGLNLDGNEDGASTPKTCQHENFTSLDGAEIGIDNQLYRLLGCVYGYRSEGLMENHANYERQYEGKGIILIDVQGVDDLQNDDSVEVSFYLSATRLDIDSTVTTETTARVIPYGSYQAVSGLYGDTVSGRIVDGVLKTDPGEVSLPAYSHKSFTDMDFRDFQLEMTLSEDGARASGLWAGYQTLSSFWERFLKAQFNVFTNQYSCPAMYVAAHNLADGYPDPETGECTAISSAFKFDAVAAFVITDEDDEASFDKLADSSSSVNR